MATETLNAHFHKLKPKQQDYICFCTREVGNRPDMHRALLPFLTIEDALLNTKLELRNLLELGDNQVGVRFAREVISKLESFTTKTLYEDEDSVIMFLSTSKLFDELGRRVRAKKFVFTLFVNEKHRFELVELERLGKDKYKVSTRRDLLHRATIYLTDSFSL
jgi:hypothetical protein